MSAGAEWFQGMTIRQELQQVTHVAQICALVPDQSSLLGILQSLINLRLPILLIKRMEWV